MPRNPEDSTMTGYALMLVNCDGQRVLVSENLLPGSRVEGRTIVAIGAPSHKLTLSGVSADQLDDLATSLRTIANDLRLYPHGHSEASDVVDAVAADDPCQHNWCCGYCDLCGTVKPVE